MDNIIEPFPSIKEESNLKLDLTLLLFLAKYFISFSFELIGFKKSDIIKFKLIFVIFSEIKLFLSFC